MAEKKEPLIVTYLKHPGKWLNALLGRPTPIEIPPDQVVHQEATGSPSPVNLQLPVSEQIPREYGPTSDSISGDMDKAKAMLGKITEKVHEIADPLVEKGVESGSHALQSSGSIVKSTSASPAFQTNVKKLLPLVLFIAVLGIVIGIGIFIFRSIGGKEGPAIVTGPTPTSAPYEPREPSIYSEDAEILKLENEITILEKEIAGTSLRETTLNPPILDFRISF